MCTIQAAMFQINGNVDLPSCNVQISDRIEIDTVVSFLSSEAGQSIYCSLVIRKPDGSTMPIYANGGNSIYISSAGTYDFIASVPISLTGSYTILSVTILNSTKSQTLCWRTF